jgi:hypothetical protein
VTFRRLASTLLALFALLSLAAGGAQGAGPDPAAQLQQQMVDIRKSTNWSDPQAAKKANEEIRKIAEQLVRLRAGKPGTAPVATGATPGGTTASASGDAEEDSEELQMKLHALSLWSSVGGGKYLLAGPLRQQIVKAYEEDRNDQIRNPEFYRLNPVLMIDFSSPAAPAVIGAMEKFQGIRTLILTGGARHASPGNLSIVLDKAKKYPLEELYLIDFGNGLSSLPSAVWGFPGLTRLAVYNNNLSILPADVGRLKKLTRLHIDGNPIRTIFTVIKPLSGLRELGVAKTKIPPDELARIAKLLPRVQVQELAP